MRHIPDEIWGQIFASLEDYLSSKNWWLYGALLKHEGLKTLRSLALVSRQFQRIAQPLLYRNLFLEGRDNEQLAQVRLLRTLCEHPQLGQCVRDVSFEDRIFRRGLDSQLGDTTLSNILKTGLASLNLPPPAIQRLERSLSRRCGLAALAASYMPHLRLIDCTLRLNDSSLPFMLSGRLGSERDSLGQLEEQNEACEDDHNDEEQTNGKYAPISMEGISTNYTFPNLTEVRIKGNCCDATTPVFVVEPILLHPTLKRLRTLGIRWNGEESRQLKWPDQRSNLQYLDLKESIIDAAGLRSVLSRCPNLKGLLIEMAGYRREEGLSEDGWIVDLNDFGNILRELGRGLEELDIHTLEYKSYRCTDGRIGSLQTLSLLKHLKIDEEDFLTVRGMAPALRLNDTLPPTLQTLYLHWGQEYYREDFHKSERQRVNKAIHSLVMGGEVDNLREIQVERYHNDTMEGEWNFELKLDGWNASVKNEHLWVRCNSPGCMRTILVLSRKPLISVD
ncbi:hypothetical protein NW762_013796 [Fusarium torreyae]|uniref:F-box domain-containing protein n=1 Tax=Fusarium torreyae TaxID=1237075 RepID=A0A9W8RMV4_9HYPO|nr:hypothetical protein NW762_013796 [Fusarium torreyae]